MRGGRGRGGRTRRSSNLAIRLVFQSRRCTCQVPRAKAVRGMRESIIMPKVECLRFVEMICGGASTMDTKSGLEEGGGLVEPCRS